MGEGGEVLLAVAADLGRSLCRAGSSARTTVFTMAASWSPYGPVPRPAGPGRSSNRGRAGHPGQVISRSELAAVMPGGSADEHAVEMAIGRLRTALGNPRVVQTLVKRGYRIAYDPEFGSNGY